jgi:predicted metal-dependent peptidase
MRVAIAFDVSGSVPDYMFQQMQEKMHVRFRQRFDEITVILYDNRIVGIMDLNHIDQVLNIPRLGNGGSNIKLVMDTIDQLNPDEAVICTDGLDMIDPARAKKYDIVIFE